MSTTVVTDKRRHSSERYHQVKSLAYDKLNRSLSPKEATEERWATPASAPWLEASNMGRVRSARTGKLRKIQVTDQGYGLCDNRMTHRLVAEAFLPAFQAANNCGLEVDHFNGCKQDNRLANLQLLGHRENIRKSCGRTVQIGQTIYPSLTSVGETYGCSPSQTRSYIARGQMPDGQEIKSVKTYTNGVVYSL